MEVRGTESPTQDCRWENACDKIHKLGVIDDINQE